MDKLNFLKRSAFFLSFIGVFLMVTLINIGVKVPKLNFFNLFLVSPLPKNTDVLEKFRYKLEEKRNEFKLKRPASLVKSAQAATDLDQANGYTVIDFESGEVLAEKNLSQKTPIASLTKIMTAVVALDLAHENELLNISERATLMEPSKVFLKTSERLTVAELLECFLLSSANDCAQAIADGIDQKLAQEGVFIRAMNTKAKFLGLENSRFQNPAGFDSSDHYSSPEDLAILTNYALKNYPLISSLVQKEFGDLEANENHKRFFLNNWNGLLGVYPGIFGMKIGFTGRAGKTTIVASEREGKRVLAIVLGAPGVLERDLWAARLLDLGFEKGWGLKPIDITEEQLREKYQTWKYLE